MLRAMIGFGVVAAASGLMGAAVHGNAAQVGGEAAKPVYYTAQVKPILDANCARCHGGENHRGGLNMDTRESLLKGGHHGPALVPGDGAKSMMVKLIRHEGPADDPMDMPPKKDKLSDADIAVVTKWINSGAVMPTP